MNCNVPQPTSHLSHSALSKSLHANTLHRQTNYSPPSPFQTTQLRQEATVHCTVSLLPPKPNTHSHYRASSQVNPLLGFSNYTCICLELVNETEYQGMEIMPILPAKLVDQVMLRLKFLEALINMSRSLFCLGRKKKENTFSG